MININDLEEMLVVMKNRVQELKAASGGLLGEHGKHREQEKRECWSGRCPICKTYIEVETEDINYESGFVGKPAGHYSKCLHCSYNDVPVKKLEL